MTKVGDEVQIIAESVIRHYRLPVSKGSNTCLINLSGNAVSSVEVADQKPLQSWTLTHPECFTSPAAFDAANDSVCCVVDHNKLLIWNINLESLKSAQKQKFNDSIFAVIPVKGQGPLVAFCTGATVPLEYTQNVSSFVGPPDLSPEEELVWIDSALLNKDIVVIQLIADKQAKKFRLQSYLLKAGKIDLDSVTSFDLLRELRSLKGYCLSSGLKQMRFLSIWDDGEVHSHSLNGSASEFLFKVPDVNKTTPVAIDVIGVSHLAVAKMRSLHTKEEAVIEVWDLKYCVMKAQKTLKQNLPKNFQMKSLGSSLFLSSKEGIIMVPVTLEACTLSAVVGMSVPERCTESIYLWSSYGSNVNSSAVSEIVLPRMPSTKDLFEEVMSEMSIKKMKVYCENLAKSSDVSEAELVNMLKSVLNDERLKHNENSEEDSNLRNTLLNAIFRVSFSDIYLRQQLKQLTFTEIVVVLENLLHIFDSQLFSMEDSEKPTDLQIVSWMQLLLQVHFEELLLSSDKDVQELLKKLQTSLFEKMDVYNELGEIKYLMMIQKKKSILPDKPVHSKYRIETLYL